MCAAGAGDERVGSQTARRANRAVRSHFRVGDTPKNRNLHCGGGGVSIRHLGYPGLDDAMVCAPFPPAGRPKSLCPVNEGAARCPQKLTQPFRRRRGLAASEAADSSGFAFFARRGPGPFETAMAHMRPLCLARRNAFPASGARRGWRPPCRSCRPRRPLRIRQVLDAKGAAPI